MIEVDKKYNARARYVYGVGYNQLTKTQKYEIRQSYVVLQKKIKKLVTLK